MANKTLNIKGLQLRGDTSANWTSVNPVLAMHELGIESDTRLFKFGDGISTWTELEYAGAKIDLSNYVTLDGAQTISGEKTFSKTIKGNAQTASKLASAKKISISGDGTGSADFDGSTNATITLSLANSGVSAGTFTKLTVDAKGRVTKGELLTANDIPALTLAKISDAGTASEKDVGVNAGNVPILDANGKLDASVIPAVAITETFVKGSQSEMLALTAQVGDVCIRTDVSRTYILSASPASTLANWKELPAPTDGGYVFSINGKTGTVTLTTSDVTEGNNLYFTTARATANFNTNIASTNVSALKDGANVVMTTDTDIIINCGNA